MTATAINAGPRISKPLRPMYVCLEDGTRVGKVMELQIGPVSVKDHYLPAHAKFGIIKGHEEPILRWMGVVSETELTG
jgi:hypothetical protein